jgi:hypothetical protein
MAVTDMTEEGLAGLIVAVLTGQPGDVGRWRDVRAASARGGLPASDRCCYAAAVCLPQPLVKACGVAALGD